MALASYKKEFFDFVLAEKALGFGEFTLKSGRKSPYFFNAGIFDSGEAIFRLGQYYAQRVVEEGIDFDLIYGPAYKGIPLAVTMAIALARDQQMNKGYVFNRKEAKEHGDKGILVGKEPVDGDQVLIIDDVFTTGGTKIEAVELLKNIANVDISGLVIALDRMEKSIDDEDAILDFTQKYGVPVLAIATVRELVEYLAEKGLQAEQEKIEAYLKKYGVTDR